MKCLIFLVLISIYAPYNEGDDVLSVSSLNSSLSVISSNDNHEVQSHEKRNIMRIKQPLASNAVIIFDNGSILKIDLSGAESNNIVFYLCDKSNSRASMYERYVYHQLKTITGGFADVNVFLCIYLNDPIKALEAMQILAYVFNKSIVLDQNVEDLFWQILRYDKFLAHFNINLERSDVFTHY